MDATEALGLLDPERLGVIALRLQALLASGAGLRSTAEIAARHRVFASVLRATGENLNIMRRVSEESLWAR